MAGVPNGLLKCRIGTPEASSLPGLGSPHPMTVRTILSFPDPRLRRRAAPVKRVDDAVRQLIDDLLESMYASGGIGLAATQIDVHRRVLVADVSEQGLEPMAFVNPKWRAAPGAELQAHEEGCLSVPGVRAEVRRHNRVLVEALDRDGRTTALEAEGLLAICLQHESDHLDGKLFVDHLSPVKRAMIRDQLRKQSCVA